MNSGDINSQFSSSQIEQGASMYADQELSVEKDKKDKQKKGPVKKKKQSTKSKAVSFLDNDTSVRELMTKSADRLVEKNVFESTEKIKQEASKIMNESLKEFFSEDAKQPLKDNVSISKTAYAAIDETYQNKQKEIQDEASELFEEERGPSRKEKAKRQAGQAAQGAYKGGINKVTVTEDNESRDKKTESKKKLYQKYLAAYTDSMIKNNKQKSREAKELRELLRSGGVSTKILNHMDKHVSQTLKKELRKQVKKSFIEVALTHKKKNFTQLFLKNVEKFEALLKMAEEKNVMGGSSDTENEIKGDAKEEIKDFILTELDETIMKQRLKSDSPAALANAFENYNSIASIAHLDASQFISKLQSKINDWGLNFYPNVEEGVIDTNSEAELDKDGEGSKKDEESEETIEMIEENLRQLFVQKCIVSGPLRTVELNLKIRAFKNKMKSMGIYSDEKIEKIKTEGEAFAKIKLMDIIREAYEERAALQELKGTAYRLVSNKFKRALKGLKKIGASVSRKELDEMRDQINKVMFSLVKEEYLKVEFYLEKNPKNMGLISRGKNLLAILERLKEESKILEDIKSSMFRETRLVSDGNVIEAA